MEKGGGNFPPKKSPSDMPASVVTPLDFPTKKLARQLDFTGIGSASASLMLPEHPQKSAIQPLLPRPQVTQMQPPPLPQSQQQPLLMPTQPQSPLPSMRPLKPESPRARARTNVEVKDGTPKKQKQCNCKHSKCLKLYCECFASGVHCDGCNCVNCHNNVENEAARREAVEATLERNPNAFRPKIASSPHGSRGSREEAGEALVVVKHNKGCHCKKSGCLKKYCECFQANVLCSEDCRCVDCKNFEGSEERQALFHGNHANNMTYIQQAANAAITGAIGSSGFGSPAISKKRKGQELFFGPTDKDLGFHRLGQYQQASHIKAASHFPYMSSIPGAQVTNGVALGPSKFTYKSLLSDIIQPQDLKELCSVLVVFSAEAAKTLSDQKNSMARKAEHQMENLLDSSAQDRIHNRKECEVEKAAADDCSSGNQTGRISPDESSSDGTDVPKGRPMSPGTLALMCDEQDTMFMAASCPKGLSGHVCNTSSLLPREQGLTEVYAEQERVVLTQFRDCLHRLITLGEIKETVCSSLARTESVGLKDPVSDGAANIRTETKHRPEPFSNGVAKSTVTSTPVTSQMITIATTTSNNNLLSKTPNPAENGDVKPHTVKDR